MKGRLRRMLHRLFRKSPLPVPPEAQEAVRKAVRRAETLPQESERVAELTEKLEQARQQSRRHRETNGFAESVARIMAGDRTL